MSRAARHVAQLRIMQATSSAWLRGPFARGSQPPVRINRWILDNQKSSAASQRVPMVQSWDPCARYPARQRRIHAAPEGRVAGREDGSCSGGGGGSGGGGAGEGRDFDPVVFWTIEAEREVMTPEAAMRKYLLDQSDIDKIKPFRRNGESFPAHRHSSEVDGSNEEAITYLTQDVQRACMAKYKSQRSFRAEQVRRKLKRRHANLAVDRRVLPLSNRYAVLEDCYLMIGSFMGSASTTRTDDDETMPHVAGTRAVYTAIGTNFIVLVTKVGALAMTGSASVLSEVVHSVADLLNQCLLAVGIYQSQKEPDQAHPYGYTTERYVFSLISGCGIFFLGCGVSIYHGINGLLMPHAIEHVTIGMSVLALSFIIESYSLSVAYQEIRAEARRQNSTVRDYIMSGSDPMNVAVLFEDSAAVLGVGVASSGLLLSYVTGIAQFDAIGSIVNGCLMGAIAIFLIQKNRHMLVGQAVSAPRLLRVVRILEEDAVVSSVHDVKAIMIGTSNGRFKAEINFDGEVLARRCMNKVRRHLEAMQHPLLMSEVENHMIVYSKELVNTIGDEVDRLEGIIRKELPEVKHVDLEIL